MYRSLVLSPSGSLARSLASQEIEPFRMTAPPPSTRTLDLYDKLREDLLCGRLKPGQKLQMRFLTEAYQAGQTPLREALNRLTSEGLVQSREQRGFIVSPVSKAELQELTMTRCWLEGLALRKSMEAATPEWRRRWWWHITASPGRHARSTPSSSRTIPTGSACTASSTAP